MRAEFRVAPAPSRFWGPWYASLFLLLSLLLASCLAGGASPSRFDGGKLQAQGFSPDVVEALRAGRAVDDHTLADIFARENGKDHDVTFLVLANPGLSQSNQMKFYRLTANDYARSGLATNPSITEEAILAILKDPSHTVYAKLGWNDSVGIGHLRTLKATRVTNLVDFAYGRNCPPEIEREIRGSDDDLAKHWLDLRASKK
jgi:hypothetical protein